MQNLNELKRKNEHIEAVLKKGVRAHLLKLSGVFHVSVGLKQKGGRITNTHCIRVYVKKKIKYCDLAQKEIIPTEIEGIPIDVNTVGTISFSDTSKRRPILGGIEISNRIIGLNSDGNITRLRRGTLGCIATNLADGKPVILGNWHVMFAYAGKKGDRIYQPGPSSIPRGIKLEDIPVRPAKDDKGNAIAQIIDYKISDKVDAAIARIDACYSLCCKCCGVEYENKISGLSVNGRPLLNTIVDYGAAQQGQTVFKVGKSTGRTEGKVVDTNFPSFKIKRDGVTFPFKGQISIESVVANKPFSDSGDSGAVVVTEDNKIIGLIFANETTKNPDGTTTFGPSMANHIADVVQALNIKINFSSSTGLNSGKRINLDNYEIENFEEERNHWKETKAELLRTSLGAKLISLVEFHQEEVMALVNQCRPVMVTWNRSQGSTFIIHLSKNLKDPTHKIPNLVAGVSLSEALKKMYDVLYQNGSESLSQDLQKYGKLILEIAEECQSANEFIKKTKQVSADSPYY